MEILIAMVFYAVVLILSDVFAGGGLSDNPNDIYEHKGGSVNYDPRVTKDDEDK